MEVSIMSVPERSANYRLVFFYDIVHNMRILAQPTERIDTGDDLIYLNGVLINMSIVERRTKPKPRGTKAFANMIAKHSGQFVRILEDDDKRLQCKNTELVVMLDAVQREDELVLPELTIAYNATTANTVDIAAQILKYARATRGGVVTTADTAQDIVTELAERLTKLVETDEEKRILLEKMLRDFTPSSNGQEMERSVNFTAVINMLGEASGSRKKLYTVWDGRQSLVRLQGFIAREE